MPGAMSDPDRVPRTRRALVLASLALALRRLWDLGQLRRCLAWERARLDGLRTTGDVDGPAIHIIVPLYREELLVPSIVAFWCERCEQDRSLRVQLVTTDKEGDAAGTTADEVRRCLAEGPVPGVEHVHVREVHDFRAAQLNAAVERVRRSSRRSPQAPWIGVYNADSRPSPATFRELRAAIARDGTTRAYQQLAQYVVPDSRPASMFMESFAALQTWWTYTRYFGRNTRARSSVRWWARTSPFSTFGHGEFFRVDLLDEIGGFPDFAYADGLLVGWLVRFGDDNIGLLASPDFAEVPRRPGLIVGQHRAWMRGLLNVRTAAHSNLRLKEGPLRPVERRLLVTAHLAVPVAWGLRPLLASLSGVHALVQLARGSRTEGVITLAALLGYAVVPQLASPAFRRTPSASRRRLRTRQLLCAPATLVLDGLGFVGAAWDAATSNGPPPKTPR